MKSMFFQLNGTHKLKHDTGAMAVEFALVAPIFFLILFATVELGIYLHDRQVLANAAREAARYGIVMRDSRRGTAEIQTQALNFSNGILIGVSLNCTTPGSDCPAISVIPDVTATPGAAIHGNSLTVTITTNFNFLLLSAFSNFATDIPVKGTSIMIFE